VIAGRQRTWRHRSAPASTSRQNPRRESHEPRCSAYFHIEQPHAFTDASDRLPTTTQLERRHACDKRKALSNWERSDEAIHECRSPLWLLAEPVIGRALARPVARNDGRIFNGDQKRRDERHGPAPQGARRRLWWINRIENKTLSTRLCRPDHPPMPRGEIRTRTHFDHRPAACW